MLLSASSVSRRSPQPTRWARSTSSPYTTGNINGQQGWSKTGPYDVEVEQTDRFGFGQALRISNAVTSGGFGDQAFSPGLTDPAGESAQKHFEASFDIANDVG